MSSVREAALWFGLFFLLSPRNGKQRALLFVTRNGEQMGFYGAASKLMRSRGEERASKERGKEQHKKRPEGSPPLLFASLLHLK